MMLHHKTSWRHAIVVIALPLVAISSFAARHDVAAYVCPVYPDASAVRTYANPVDLPYRMRPEKGQDFREGADPEVVMHDGRYWMFASKCGGYYVSDDLVKWRFVATDDLPLEEYAPTAWEMEGLQACTWLAALFDDDLSRLSYRPEFLSGEKAALMRRCAAEAVKARKSSCLFTQTEARQE